MSMLERQILLRSAEAGDAKAQFDLGLSYLQAACSQQDVDQAVTWLHRAAMRNHPDALFTLAQLYLQGRAGTSDRDPLNRALGWLVRAKELGHPEAGKYFQAVMVTLQADHPGEYDAEYDELAEADESRRDYDDEYGAEEYADRRGETEPDEEEIPDSDYLIVDDKMMTKRRSLQTLADMGHTRALAVLGELYLRGIDGPKDEQKALECFRKAADQDDPPALYRLGSFYLSGSDSEARDFSKARQFLFRAVALGSSAALFSLGELYAHEQNKNRDYRKAAQYFEKAKEAGITDALARLAELYTQGQGVPQDDGKALELYTQGARAGSSEAQYGLALAYLNGRGTEIDLPRALKWLRKAAENGFAPAREQLDQLEPPAAAPAAPSKTSAAQAAPPSRESSPAAGSSAAPGRTESCAAEGNVSVPPASTGIAAVSQGAAAAAQPERDSGSVPPAAAPAPPDLAAFTTIGAASAALRERLRTTPDPVLELRVRHAEQSGEAMAACHMGVICEKDRDWESARRWYAQAARQGEALGLYNLGVLWETGRGGERDWQQALACYARAARQGYAKARYNLCLLYARGRGTERDLEQARSWCVKAAEQGLPEAKKLAEVFNKHLQPAAAEADTESAEA